LLAHPLLPLPRSAPVRLRSVRRPFTPPAPQGPYRLPHRVRDCLTSALAPYRNRDAALALAVFIGRFWSIPSRVLTAFPIDRRELADRPDLGLTEAQVRGAIRALERVGFLDRAVATGSTHKPTPDGLHRKPILFMFGADYGPLFMAANRRAAAARGRRTAPVRPATPQAPRRASTAVPRALPLKSPKNISEAIPTVLMGQLGLRPPARIEPNSSLEAALDRFRRAAEGTWRT
jgi:hypothetical protein